MGAGHTAWACPTNTRRRGVPAVGGTNFKVRDQPERRAHLDALLVEPEALHDRARDAARLHQHVSVEVLGTVRRKALLVDRNVDLPQVAVRRGLDRLDKLDPCV